MVQTIDISTFIEGGPIGNFTPEDADELTNKLKEYMLEGAEKIIATDFNLTSVPLNDIDVYYASEGKGGTAAYVTTSMTGGALSYKLTFDMDDVVGMNEGQLESLVVHEMTHAMMSATAGSNWFDYPRWFAEGTAEIITGANSRVRSDLGINPTEVDINSALSILDSTDPAEYQTSKFYSISVLATKYLDNQLKANGATNGIKDIMGKLSIEANLDDAIKSATSNAYSLTSFKTDLSSTTGLTTMKNYVINQDLNPYGSSRNPADLISNTPEPLNNATNFNYKWESDESENGLSELSLQIGANEGQTMKVKLPNISTTSLGIGQVDISTQDAASKAITSYDSAIKLVSEQRSNLGAIQNRLEHTINNLGAASENLTAAESRIRDTDMAAEMMNFTKQNIFMQAAQSMLSQANQQPQGVLQLLG